MLSRRSSCRYRLVVVLFAGALALLAPSFGSAQSSPTEAAHPKPDRAALASLQDAFADIADSLEPAVVTIYTSKSLRTAADAGDSSRERDAPKSLFPFDRTRRRATSTGSGVLISKDGWVLTNDHVAGGADRVTVRLHDGREFPGTVRRDYRSDLALVKITASEPFPFARLGDSDRLRIGQWAIAIGSPYRYEGSFSVGVVSSLFRRQQISDYGAGDGGRLYPSMIQTDAAINPGNSGGPLCNLNGEVIGINTAIESEGGGSVGIGFAIPINSARFVISQLQQTGRVHYGYLGVDPTSVTPRTAAALKVEQGALVQTEPQPGSPAEKAGLHVGDVVTAIGAKTVRNELDLRTLVAQTTPGTTVELAVIREGQTLTLKAVLEEARELPADTPHAPGKTHLGIEVQPLSKTFLRDNNLPQDTRGVAIKAIDPDTAAAEAEELTEGLVILRVNGKETPTVQEFQAATAQLKAGDQVRLVVAAGTPEGLVKRFVIVSID